MPNRPALGLFDIMQVDPLSAGSTAEMYATRLDQWALADELGFDAGFIAERHFMPQFACSSASVWLAAASQRCPRMRLGAMGYTLPLREPVELAEEVAMLDQLTGGRLEIGFGLGHRQEEFVARGLESIDRVVVFQERLALMQALWSGGAVTLEDESTTIRGVQVSPLVNQQPHPPLWFAGTNPAAAQWTASRGLQLALGFKATAQLAPAAAAYRAGVGARGDLGVTEVPSPLGSVALMRNVSVAETDDDARNEVIDDLMRLDRHFNVALASVSSATHRAETEKRYDGMAASDVMIAGSPDTVARRIREAQEGLRIDVFLANPWAAGVPAERIERNLRLLAGPVRERLG